MTVDQDRNTMYVYFEGNLDISVCSALRKIAEIPPGSPAFWVLNFDGIVRVFDSGIATIKVMAERLRKQGKVLMVSGDCPSALQGVGLGLMPLDADDSAGKPTRSAHNGHG
jgi:hypothetical protein